MFDKLYYDLIYKDCISSSYPLDQYRDKSECKKAIDKCYKIAASIEHINADDLTPRPFNDIVGIYYFIIRTGLLAKRHLINEEDKELRIFLDGKILEPFETLKNKLKERFNKSGKEIPQAYKRFLVGRDGYSKIHTKHLISYYYIHKVPFNVDVNGVTHSFVYGRKFFDFGSSNIVLFHIGGPDFNSEELFYDFAVEHNSYKYFDSTAPELITECNPFTGEDLMPYPKSLIDFRVKLREKKENDIQERIEINRRREEKKEAIRKKVVKPYFNTDNNFNKLSYDDKVNVLKATIEEDLFAEITYKGTVRIIEPLSIVGDKLNAEHIEGYSKSNSYMTRSFFVDKIESIKIIKSRESMIKSKIKCYLDELKGIANDDFVKSANELISKIK